MVRGERGPQAGRQPACRAGADAVLGGRRPEDQGDRHHANVQQVGGGAHCGSECGWRMSELMVDVK